MQDRMETLESKIERAERAISVLAAENRQLRDELKTEEAVDVGGEDSDLPTDPLASIAETVPATYRDDALIGASEEPNP